MTIEEILMQLYPMLDMEPAEAKVGEVLFRKWLERGDGVAVYENQDLGHFDLGHKQFVSYGSIAAQLPEAEPPQRLPDIGSEINWRYQLVAKFRAFHPDDAIQG